MFCLLKGSSCYIFVDSPNSTEYRLVILFYLCFFIRKVNKESGNIKAFQTHPNLENPEIKFRLFQAAEEPIDT